MKIIQSFWSKPAFNSSSSYWSRNLGGWLDQKYHLYSWALSFLTIQKQYPYIELITDDTGFDLLCKKIKLPYSRVLLSLNTLNRYDPNLFAIGKVFSYSLQNEPFIHIDSDVYIWEPFPQRITNNALISQNLEMNFRHDIDALQDVISKFRYLPTDIKNYKEGDNFVSSNAGILGGQNIDFFKNYSREAFRFINRNNKQVKNLNIPAHFNIIFEQYLFTNMAKARCIDISYLFENLTKNYQVELCEFSLVPKIKRFIHVIGPNKRLLYNSKAVENRLLLEFPEYFYRINKLISNHQL